MVKTKHHEAIPMPGAFPTNKTIPALKSNKSFVGLSQLGPGTGSIQSPRLPTLSDLNPTATVTSMYSQGFNALNYQKSALGQFLCSNWMF